MARTTIRSEDITAGQIKSADLETNVVIDGDLTVDTDTLHVDSTNNRVGIGTSSPFSLLHVSSGTNTDGTDVTITIGGTSANTRQSLITKKIQSSDRALEFYAASGGSSEDIRFFRDNTNETMRIDDSGNLLVGTTLLTNRLSVAQSTAGSAIARFDHTNATASSVYGLFVYFPSAAPDDNTQYFFKGQDSSAERIIIHSDGDIVNHDNSYGAISDQKLKDQIVDSGSQWNDIKSLQVRKFKFKTDIADKGDSDNLWRLGVIAQEVEAAGMSGLVKESTDIDENNNDLGTTTKTVNYSVLYMKAVKALQEAMTRIETLEAEVATLKGA